MRVTIKMKASLCNPHNKMQLIQILRQRFVLCEITTDQSHNDTDVLVVKEAQELATTESVTIVADYIGILVLAMYHWNKDSVPVKYSIKHVLKCLNFHKNPPKAPFTPPPPPHPPPPRIK